ncbi:MAG: OmpA family protein [Kiritimatiellae bacterium]|nr:OmpA family protein [Kiritimatiellia bacterium]
MQIRSLLVVTALMGAMVVMDTGCRTKAGGWRLPWQDDVSTLSNGVEIAEPTVATDVAMVTDEMGAPVTGARFEDALNKVQGLNFAPVYFAFDSYMIPPTELPKVQAVADHLKQNMDHVLIVEGNTDERGSNEYNLSLGENRAQTVRNAIIGMGVMGDRIQTRSFGEEKPAVQGAGEEAWRMNRRDEFSIYQK